MRPCPLLVRLRERTATVHRSLEEVTAAHRIMDGSLTPAEYDRLIDWQYRAHLELEPLVAGYVTESYGYRSRLEFLGKRPPTAGTATPTGTTDPLIALGTAYVLEGASLGGSMIHRRLLGNRQLAARRPFPFYAAQAAFGIDQWKHYVAHLAALSLTADDEERVVTAAQGAFATFRRLWVE